MGNRDTRIGGGEVGVEVYGAISDLTRTVKNALLSEGGGTGILIDLPTVDTSFTPIYEVDGSDIFVTLAFFIPGFTTELTVFTLDSTLVTNEATYNSKRKKYTITDIGDADREAQRIERRIEIPLKPERLHYIPLLRAWDGDSKHDNPEDGFDFSGYPGNVLFSFTTPAAFGAPSSPDASLVRFNRRDQTTLEAGDAEFSGRVWAPLTAAGTAQNWGASGCDQVVQVIEKNDTVPYLLPKSPHLLSGVELTQTDPASTPVADRGYVDLVTKTLVAGGDYDWVSNIAWASGVKATSTGAAYNFKAANEDGGATALDNLTNVLLSARTTDPFDGNHVQPYLEFTMPAAPVPALKNFTFRMKKSSATQFGEDNIVDRDNTIQNDAYHYVSLNVGTISVGASSTALTGAGGADFTKLQSGWRIKAAGQTLTIGTVNSSTSITLTANSGAAITAQAYVVVIVHPLVPSVKVKPSLTYNLQVVLRARGGDTRTIDGTIAIGADGAVLSDTAVPTLSTNPDTGTTGPTVSERHSKIDVFCPLPSANISTLDNYQVILSTSASAPAGNPTVNSEGVLVIKYGQNPSFNLSYFADFGDQFYVGFRAHNQFGTGYSLWSAMTNQDGYSRPLQDFIGDAVPDNSEGLVRAGNSQAGNTTATVKLDSGASPIDDFYNGNALHLTSPGTSSPDADTWRTITDYNGTTKVATVDTVYSSAPADGVSFDVHAIGIPGDRATKSGTGHTTAVFVLESGLSVATDFFKGYTLYIPTMATASDRIRKVTAYDNTTKALTVDIAFGTAPSDNLGYLLINGSIGFSSASNADSLTGIAAPVPFRWYLNDQDILVFEILPPIGENAFSLTHFQIKSNRRSTNALRDDSGAIAIVSGTGYKTDAAPAGTFWASAIRFKNMFRDIGIDGWGIYSYFVAVLSATDAPNYDPDDFGSTVIIDYQGTDSYPTQRYPDYI